MEVGNAEDNGIFVKAAGNDGVVVSSAGDDGVYVNTATDDGLHVGLVGDDGLQVDFANGGHGVNVYSASHRRHLRELGRRRRRARGECRRSRHLRGHD